MISWIRVCISLQATENESFSGYINPNQSCLMLAGPAPPMMLSIQVAKLIISAYSST